MAENGGISADEFTRLQTQLIELRTENYEIAEKYRKTKEENNVLQDKVESKEREVQRIGKLMKIPGLQAFTKNKGKRSYDEIVEENERIIQQMQRHEEDFNLQNKTLLEEISRLSVERDEYENELKKLKDTRTRQLDENDELLKIKAENTVLHKKLQDYESRNIVDGKIDKENTENDLAEGEDKEISSIGDEEDGNSSIQQIVEAMYLEFRKKNNNLEDVNEGEEVEEIDEKERNFMETLIAKLKTLSTKAQVKPESSLLANEVAVRLETEEAENRLLRDQIKDERERTRIEIEALKAEVEKLTEKTKRKQESYLQLQEEKETLHKEKSRLEEEWIKTKELLAKSEDTEVELQEQVEMLSKENEEIKIEMSSLREKLEHCSPERVSELEQTLRGKHEELTSLKAQIEESSSLNQDMMLEVQKLSEEKAKIENDASQNQELANKRKKLLDELSVERQHELSTHKKELEDSKNENEEQKKKLELTMSDLEKAKREVTLANDRHSELLKNYSSLEKKAGWLERTLKESEEQLEANKKTHEDSILLKEKELAEKLSSVDEEHQAEIEVLNGEKAEVEKERDEKVSIIEKMNQTAKDKEVEFRISGKKSEQLLKDLKRQLKTERKRSDQIQQRLQDFLSESKTKQTFDEIFKSDPSLQKGHRRQDSGSHLSTVSSGSGLELSIDNEANKTSTPLSGTPLSGGSESIKLTNETVELISKVADLQLEKNVLEEKVRFLEENSSVMVDDLMRKSEIIQNYVRDTKPDMLSDTAKKKNMTLKEKMKDSLSIGKHGKSEDMLKEMNAKMQRLLEETLEKNIQLEKDVDHLTKELENASKAASP